MSYKKQDLLTLRENMVSIMVFGGVCVAHLFSFLCCVVGGSVLLIFLVFCVVLLVGLCCSSF